MPAHDCILENNCMKITLTCAKQVKKGDTEDLSPIDTQEGIAGDTVMQHLHPTLSMLMLEASPLRWTFLRDACPSSFLVFLCMLGEVVGWRRQFAAETCRSDGSEC